jgi:hypothetical protein
MNNLTGYFTSNYGPLIGSDWIRRLPDYEQRAFSYIGRMSAGHGKLGGIARANTAKRQSNGRFASD